MLVGIVGRRDFSGRVSSEAEVLGWIPGDFTGSLWNLEYNGMEYKRRRQVSAVTFSP